jgi:hypothetical protein
MPATLGRRPAELYLSRSGVVGRWSTRPPHPPYARIPAGVKAPRSRHIGGEMMTSLQETIAVGLCRRRDRAVRGPAPSRHCRGRTGSIAPDNLRVRRALLASGGQIEAAVLQIHATGHRIWGLRDHHVGDGRWLTLARRRRRRVGEEPFPGGAAARRKVQGATSRRRRWGLAGDAGGCRGCGGGSGGGRCGSGGGGSGSGCGIVLVCGHMCSYFKLQCTMPYFILLPKVDFVHGM